MNEFIFVGGSFEVDRIFIIKAESEDKAYDILCEKQNIEKEKRKDMRHYYRGILIQYEDNYFETDDF